MVNVMNVIKVEALSKAFGNNIVFDDVSFEVNKGETVAIIGPSGAGKSTMLRCLIDLETADKGSIIIEDNYLVKDGVYTDKISRKTICSKMGMVFQNFNLFPHLSVMKNLIYAPVYVKGEDKASATSRAFEILKKVGMADRPDAMPSELSGGQKQRVAIARTLMVNPDVILFDEPTSSLDPQLTGEVLSVIKKLANEKMTMIIVTHEMAFAKEVADRIIFMADRRMLESGTPDEIFNSPKNEITKSFIRSIL